MQKILFALFFLTIYSVNCFAEFNSSFIIPTGTKISQLGFKYEDGNALGPISIAEFNNEIYILDEVNLRINIYTYRGKFIKSIKIPKIEGFYQDFAINAQGNVILLTSEGIFTLTNNGKLSNKRVLPNFVSVPYYISIDILNNIIFNGLRIPNGKTGVVSGVFDNGGKFKELEGFLVISSFKGLIGLWNSDNTVSIYNKDEICYKISTPSDKTIPFGLTDRKEIYCAERNENGFKFYKVSKQGIINTKEFRFSSRLLGDESTILRSFLLTKNEDVICLDANEKRCQVMVFHF